MSTQLNMLYRISIVLVLCGCVVAQDPVCWSFRTGYSAQADSLVSGLSLTACKTVCSTTYVGCLGVQTDTADPTYCWLIYARNINTIGLYQSTKTAYIIIPCTTPTTTTPTTTTPTTTTSPTTTTTRISCWDYHPGYYSMTTTLLSTLETILSCERECDATVGCLNVLHMGAYGLLKNCWLGFEKQVNATTSDRASYHLYERVNCTTTASPTTTPTVTPAGPRNNDALYIGLGVGLVGGFGVLIVGGWAWHRHWYSAKL